MTKTTIDLDCGEMPPACGFQCGACIQEIMETLEKMDGVKGFSQHLDGRIEVEHDLARVTTEDLIRAISGLPSSQEGFFRATLAERQRETAAERQGTLPEPQMPSE